MRTDVTASSNKKLHCMSIHFTPSTEDLDR